MREIKFRAWDGINEIFVYFILEKQGNFCPEFPEGRNLSDWMQYTGLKDKNRKEIYEGDNIEITHEGVDERRKKFTTKSKKTVKGLLYAYEYDSEERVEVIGNIYENPEMLRGLTP